MTIFSIYTGNAERFYRRSMDAAVLLRLSGISLLESATFHHHASNRRRLDAERNKTAAAAVQSLNAISRIAIRAEYDI
jgi:hypothetical protein